VKEDEIGRAWNTNGGMKDAYGIFGKREGKIPQVTSRRRWMDCNKMNISDIEWGGVDWTYLADDRNQWRTVVNAVMNLRLSKTVGKFLSS
jgi:hypothetical protein